MILALDSATRTYGVALHDGRRVLAEQTWRGRGHASSEFPPEVAVVMRRAGVTPADLRGVAVALGPGSFNGLRIGLALAKGLALARGLPVVGVPTHEILAEGQPARKEPLLVLVEAGRGRAAGQRFHYRAGRWQTLGGAEAKTWDAWWEGVEEPTWICGEMEDAQRESAEGKRNLLFAPAAWSARRPAVLAEIAWKQIDQTSPAATAQLAPIYLDSESGPTA